MLRRNLLTLIGFLHQLFVFRRRTEVLAGLIADWLPKNAFVLDVGCGDGLIDWKIAQKRRDVKIYGLEIFKRKESRIPVRLFDGKKIPYPNSSFDCCLLIDVLHHSDKPYLLLKETARVARHSLIIKDHLAENFPDRIILKVMDWFGNYPYRVNLTYNYWNKAKWEEIFKDLGLFVEKIIDNLPLYPLPFSLIFGRKKHFLASLRIFKKN